MTITCDKGRVTVTSRFIFRFLAGFWLLAVVAGCEEGLNPVNTLTENRDAPLLADVSGSGDDRSGEDLVLAPPNLSLLDVGRNSMTVNVDITAVERELATKAAQLSDDLEVQLRIERLPVAAILERFGVTNIFDIQIEAAYVIDFLETLANVELGYQGAQQGEALIDGLQSATVYRVNGRSCLGQITDESCSDYGQGLYGITLPEELDSTSRDFSVEPFWDRTESSWEATPGASHYKLYRDELASPTSPPDGSYDLLGIKENTAHTDTEVSLNTTYIYKLEACQSGPGGDELGCTGEMYEERIVTILDSLNQQDFPAANLTVEGDLDSIRVSIESLQDESTPYYQLQKRDDQGNYQPLAQFNEQRLGAQPVHSYTDEGLEGLTTYYYRVRVCRDEAATSCSKWANGTGTTQGAPGATNDLTAESVGVRNIDIGWTVKGELASDSYKIYYRETSESNYSILEREGAAQPDTRRADSIEGLNEYTLYKVHVENCVAENCIRSNEITERTLLDVSVYDPDPPGSDGLTPDPDPLNPPTVEGLQPEDLVFAGPAPEGGEHDYDIYDKDGNKVAEGKGTGEDFTISPPLSHSGAPYDVHSRICQRDIEDHCSEWTIQRFDFGYAVDDLQAEASIHSPLGAIINYSITSQAPEAEVYYHFSYKTPTGDWSEWQQTQTPSSFVTGVPYLPFNNPPLTYQVRAQVCKQSNDECGETTEGEILGVVTTIFRYDLDISARMANPGTATPYAIDLEWPDMNTNFYKVYLTSVSGGTLLSSNHGSLSYTYPSAAAGTYYQFAVEGCDADDNCTVPYGANITTPATSGNTQVEQACVSGALPPGYGDDTDDAFYQLVSPMYEKLAEDARPYDTAQIHCVFYTPQGEGNLDGSSWDNAKAANQIQEINQLPAGDRSNIYIVFLGLDSAGNKTTYVAGSSESESVSPKGYTVITGGWNDFQQVRRRLGEVDGIEAVLSGRIAEGVHTDGVVSINLSSGNASVLPPVVIDNLVIADGSVAGSSTRVGAGIESSGASLLLQHVRIHNHRSLRAGVNRSSAIYAIGDDSSSLVSLYRTHIHDNLVTSSGAGGGFLVSHRIEVTESLVENNQVDDRDGLVSVASGGLWLFSDYAFVYKSTIRGNQYAKHVASASSATREENVGGLLLSEVSNDVSRAIVSFSTIANNRLFVKENLTASASFRVNIAGAGGVMAHSVQLTMNNSEVVDNEVHLGGADTAEVEVHLATAGGLVVMDQTFGNGDTAGYGIINSVFSGNSVVEDPDFSSPSESLKAHLNIEANLDSPHRLYLSVISSYFSGCSLDAWLNPTQSGRLNGCYDFGHMTGNDLELVIYPRANKDGTRPFQFALAQDAATDLVFNSASNVFYAQEEGSAALLYTRLGRAFYLWNDRLNGDAWIDVASDETLASDTEVWMRIEEDIQGNPYPIRANNESYVDIGVRQYTTIVQ